MGAQSVQNLFGSGGFAQTDEVARSLHAQLAMTEIRLLPRAGELVAGTFGELERVLRIGCVCLLEFDFSVDDRAWAFDAMERTRCGGRECGCSVHGDRLVAESLADVAQNVHA